MERFPAAYSPVRCSGSPSNRAAVQQGTQRLGMVYSEKPDDVVTGLTQPISAGLPCACAAWWTVTAVDTTTKLAAKRLLQHGAYLATCP